MRGSGVLSPHLDCSAQRSCSRQLKVLGLGWQIWLHPIYFNFQHLERPPGMQGGRGPRWRLVSSESTVNSAVVPRARAALVKLPAGGVASSTVMAAYTASTLGGCSPVAL